MFRYLLFAFFLITTGCPEGEAPEPKSPPEEKSNEDACSTDNPCLPGWTCVSGTCEVASEEPSVSLDGGTEPPAETPNAEADGGMPCGPCETGFEADDQGRVGIPCEGRGRGIY